MGIWGASFFIGQFVNPLVISSIKHFAGSITAAVTIVGIICLVIAVAVWLPKYYVQRSKTAGMNDE